MTRAYALCFAVALVACGDSESRVDASMGADDAATGADSSIDSAIDAPVTPTDGAIGTTCGTAFCTPTQECCVGGGGGSTCVDMGTCTTVTFDCDGPEDCGTNEVCCFGNGGGGGAAGGAECKPANQCQNNACHTAGDCTGTANMCCPLAQTGYSICLANCPP